ncbi:MAG TPA: response regulator transcription factor [Candidatus Dormibacteraeota bacterium]|nr:response regulator transcription factor [Candidatus Dormibacteraeota bacterium]
MDPDALSRVGIQSFFERTSDLRVVAEAATLGEARIRMEGLPETAGILIADVPLRDGSGIDIIAEARRREPPLDVIVHCTTVTSHTLRRALALGARGVVLKCSGGEALLAAIAWVQQGQVYLDPNLGDVIAEALAHPENVDRLASDERLLALLSRGLTDKDIARVTGKTDAAVSRDVAMLLRRMGVTSRAAAVGEAVRRGLLP